MLKGTPTMKIVKVVVHERKLFEPEYKRGRQTRSSRMERSEFYEPTRVYVEPTTYSVMENLFNRRNRPWKAYKPLVEAELRNAGVQGKVHWSQYAGCKMCPCSPGFVLEDAIKLDETPIDIYITVAE
jgi:hypothetical protein